MSRTVSMQFGKPGAVVQNGTSSGGNDWVLLWTNPNPTSNFAAQTIPIDLSKYSFLLICYNQTPTGARWGSVFQPKDGAQYFVTIGIDSTSNNYYYKRAAAATDTGITFTNGFQNTTSGAGYAIPKYIYGI